MFQNPKKGEQLALYSQMKEIDVQLGDKPRSTTFIENNQ